MDNKKGERPWVHYHVPIGEEDNYEQYRFVLTKETYGTITRWSCPVCFEYHWYDSSTKRAWTTYGSRSKKTF